MACSIRAVRLLKSEVNWGLPPRFSKSAVAFRSPRVQMRGLHASRSVLEEIRDDMKTNTQLEEQRRARMAEEEKQNETPETAEENGEKSKGFDPDEVKPAVFDQIKIEDISDQLRQEITNFSDHVDALEEAEACANELHQVLAVIGEVKAQREAADSLGKEVADLTVIEFAQWRLKQQQEFAKNLDMSSTPLYSVNESFRLYNETLSIIEHLYPAGELPEWLSESLESMANNYMNLKMGERIRALRVSDHVYREVKKNLFPDLLERGVTAEEFVDCVGGGRELMTPLAMHVRDVVIKWMDAPLEEKFGLANELFKLVKSFNGGAEPPEEESAELRKRQSRAYDSVCGKLGRLVKNADFCLERRLSFDSTDSSHPILSTSPTYYVHGRVDNMEELSHQISENKVRSIVWQKLDNFNPPTHLRPLSLSILEMNPKLREGLQIAALNFPMWEGKRALGPMNSSEMLIQLKLWKLFNYLYPKLAHDEKGQAEFMEEFDISPGEVTLEWALSYPPKEHTFYPESPLWIHPFEDDEDEAPINWPPYETVALSGETNVAIVPADPSEHPHDVSSDADASSDSPNMKIIRAAIGMLKDPEFYRKNPSGADLHHLLLAAADVHESHGHRLPERYVISAVQDQDQDDRCEAIYHAAWKKLSEDQRNCFTVEEAYRVLSSLTPAEIADAECYWKTLSLEQRHRARTEWKDSKFDDDDDRSRGAEEIREFLTRLQ